MLPSFAVFFIGLVTWGLTGYGGTVSIVGNGEASLPPNEYTMDLTVTSVCYPTTKNAKSANSQLANQIIDLTRSYMDSADDELHTIPGGFVRTTEYLPSENDRSKILCENRWRTWNTIRLTLHHLERLPEIQDELVAFLSPMESINPEKAEQTYIQISSPHFGLKEDNFVKLKQEAQIAALQDAKNQLDNFSDRCNFKSLNLMSVAPPSFDSIVRYGAKSVSTGESSTPVIPEEIIVTSTWNFVWHFDSAPQCYQ